LMCLPGLWLATVAKCVRECRAGRRTSRSTFPPLSGLPRGLRRAQPALRALLPDTQFHRCFAERKGEVFDLGLKLGLAGRRAGLPGSQRGLACFEELGLPSADRLLGDLLLPSRFSDGDLAGQHAQHDPGLGLRTEHRWSSHGQVLLLSDADHALITGLPESMTRDTTVVPAVSSDVVMVDIR